MGKIIITDATQGVHKADPHDHIDPQLLVTAMSGKTLAEELRRLLARLPLATGSREFALIAEAADRTESQ